MKTSVVCALAAVLLLSGATFAQENSGPPRPNNAVAVSAKPLTVAGQVSNDRKTLMTDIDSEWRVSNPDALKGHEGRRVTVKCYVDTGKNTIQVLSVKKEESGSSYAARSTDSAFRR